MRNALVVMALMLGSISILACGTAAPPQPLLAEDPTASAATRQTEIGTCRWIPALPAFREDPCLHLNQGNLLEVTERDDMRAESATFTTHTCTCD